MDDNEIKKMIQLHEGFRPYIYPDSLGFLTGGYGHCFLPRSPISHDVANLLFEEDFDISLRSYNKLKLDLDPVRRAVIIDMLFNLGLSGVRGFKKMLDCLRKDDYIGASYHMLDSLWASQVKGRARELAEMMEKGEV